MSDYEPIDLSPICNTGISVLGDDKVSDPRLDEADLMWRGHTFGSTPDGKSVPIGRQTLRRSGPIPGAISDSVASARQSSAEGEGGN